MPCALGGPVAAGHDTGSNDSSKDRVGQIPSSAQLSHPLGIGKLP